MDLAQLVWEAPEAAVRLSVEQVHTLDGACRLWVAERRGRARPGALRAIERRIAELRREVPVTRAQIIVAGTEG